jgi:hypothetical protein
LSWAIIVSGLVPLVLTRLVSEETRHLHNEFTLLTVTNTAVLYTVLLVFIAIAAWENMSKASDEAGGSQSRREPVFRRPAVR